VYLWIEDGDEIGGRWTMDCFDPIPNQNVSNIASVCCSLSDSACEIKGFS
jgi:hypothetical protein